MAYKKKLDTIAAEASGSSQKPRRGRRPKLIHTDDPEATGRNRRPLKYINGDEKRGIKYDWKEIRKAYNALGCPPEYFNPTLRPFERFKYLVEFSRRGTGKTTGILLLGMVMNWLYGTQIIYIRQTEDMIAPKNTKNMFSNIVEYGYIEKITGGVYNNVCYKSRRWYFCRTDETGNIVEVSNEYFCFMCDIQHGNALKSGFNAPFGDFLVYDEFVNPYYYPDEFVNFCDLVSTIIRQRFSPFIWMVSNNTDKESPYFYELEIYDDIQTITKGSHGEHITEKGTGIYFEWYAPETEVKKSGIVLNFMNKLFFGFKNKKLGSITGDDWAIKPAQHIPQSKEPPRPIIQNLYIFHNGRYLRLDVVKHETLGICCYVHWATKTYPDSVILTIEDRTDPRYYYGLGSGRLRKLILDLISQNRIYYPSNDVAAFTVNYIKSIP